MKFTQNVYELVTEAEKPDVVKRLPARRILYDEVLK